MGAVTTARSVKEETRVDLFRRSGQKVQIVEGTFVAEAAQLVVAHHRFIPSTPVGPAQVKMFTSRYVVTSIPLVQMHKLPLSFSPLELLQLSQVPLSHAGHDGLNDLPVIELVQQLLVGVDEVVEQGKGLVRLFLSVDVTGHQGRRVLDILFAIADEPVVIRLGRSRPHALHPVCRFGPPSCR